MTYELLFLDMDGTLKQEPDPISEGNKMAILKATGAEKKISIASGRSKAMLLPTVKELGLDKSKDTYTIALNGAHIVSSQTGQTLHTEEIPMNLTRILFEKSLELEISSHVYTENLVYFNYQDYQFEWYQNEGCDCYLVDLGQDDMGLKEPPLKFFLHSKEPLKLEQFKEEVIHLTKDLLIAEFSSLYSLEFTSIQVSKGQALRYICDLHQLPTSAAIAAGDGENDISMIQAAGLGIAMKNALDTVKAVADTVTKSTCREDGVAEIIENYLLSKTPPSSL